MGDREILETYLNSTSKNTSETNIFPHGPKYLLTIVISECPNGEIVLTAVAVCVISVPTSVTVSENCQTVLTFVAVGIGI